MGNGATANMNQTEGGIVIVLSDKIEFLWAPYKTLSSFAIFRCSYNSLPGRHCQWALCLPHLQGKWPNLTPEAGGEAAVPGGVIASLQRRSAFPSLCSDSWDVAGRLRVCRGREWQRPQVWSEKLFPSSQLSPRGAQVWF